MLIHVKQPNFIEKILIDSFGRQYRVLFAVSFVDGEVRGRVISVTPLTETAQLDGDLLADSNAPLCLPNFSSATNSETEYVPAFVPTVSPYFSLEFLINSQPTRAPSRT